PASLRGHPVGAILRQATIKDVARRDVTADSLLHDLEACDVEGLRREMAAEPGALSLDGPGTAQRTMRFSRTPQSTPPTDGERTPASPGDLDDVASLRQLEGERRPLTVVCCALTATGPGLEAVDVEEVDEALGEEQEICAEIARRHRGSIAGALGERVFLYFGHPAAQEDDARRAARAALEIVAEARARSAALTSARGVALEARIGIHTGLVIAREGHSSAQALGTTTQIAAQLSALAAPGSIVASGETRRLLRGHFLFEAEGTHRLPGVARPVEVYRLQDELAAPSSPRSSADADTARLVGRIHELELLLQRWSQTQQGAGQCVLLTGGQGIGKSRLAHELGRRLRCEPHVCLECRCAEEIRYSALRPVIEMIERHLELGSETADEKLARIEALLRRHGCNLDEAVPLIAGLLSVPFTQRYAAPDGSPQRQKERKLNLLLSLLCEMAEQQPVLLVAEDLQWADPVTLEWLGALVDEVASTRIMALFTARPELSPPWQTSGMLQIQLGRLDRVDTEQMIGDLAGGRTLPGPVLEQIAARADGVPLFIEELTRMVIESTAPAGPDGCSTPAPHLSELAIPTTLRGLLTARLDRLGRARETAQIAAALGREFSFEVLEVVSSLDEDALRADLEKLLAADLVHRRRRVNAPTYVFKHGLIRDAAYESLPRRARLRVHASIARTLEERFPEVVRTRPGLLAHHHAAAEQKRPAIVYAERAAGALGPAHRDGRPRERGHDAGGLPRLLTQLPSS
ncbi:MAG: AAA family ATPase, partial [Byssovorax sp.]